MANLSKKAVKTVSELNEDDEMFGDTHHTNQQIECITLQQATAVIYMFVRLH